MLLLIGAFVASMIPCAAMFLWLRNRKGMQEGYPQVCNRALMNGFLTVLPVILASATFAVIGNLLNLKDGNQLLYQVYYTFCVLALSEELCKFYVMRRIVKKGNYSWFTVTVIMTLVGLGFEIAEAIPYAIGSGPGPMFVRGLSMMHASYGFIMGYFYAKSLYERKKGYAVLGIVLPWILHGTYDFFLSEPMFEMGWPGYAALGLAVFSVVLIILFIRFVIKSGKNEDRIRPVTE